MTAVPAAKLERARVHRPAQARGNVSGSAS
jgi:hypothetical protein